MPTSLESELQIPAMRTRSLRVVLLFAIAVCVPSLNGRAEPPQEPLTFAVMGDVPYAEGEYDLLKKQLAELPNCAEFVVHVGDIKRGVLPCTEGIYIRVAEVLRESKPPVFIIPGDNEWNDCILPTPKTAWGYWKKQFLRFDSRWNHKLPVRRQLSRLENFAMVQKEVLIIGVNLVGGRVHDKDEWDVRQGQDVKWLEEQFSAAGSEVVSAVVLGHAFPGSKDRMRFETGFLDVAKKFDRPIAYIHGDGHKWVHDRPWKKCQNVERIQVDQGGIAPPLLVTPPQSPGKPFVFDRRKPNAK
jgi:hypothetical protein